MSNTKDTTELVVPQLKMCSGEIVEVVIPSESDYKKILGNLKSEDKAIHYCPCRAGDAPCAC